MSEMSSKMVNSLFSAYTILAAIFVIIAKLTLDFHTWAFVLINDIKNFVKRIFS